MKRITTTKQMALALLLMIATAFSSCEIEDDNSPSSAAEDSAKELPPSETFYENAIDDAEVFKPSEEMKVSASEKSTVQVFSTTKSVAQGNTYSVRISAEFMQPGYKFTAYLTPIVGDPDLYIFRYSPFQFIRRSVHANNTVDISYVSGEDMLSSEDYGYFVVHGYTASQFRLDIYYEPLYPTAANVDDYPFDGTQSRCHTDNNQSCTADTWGMCEDNCTSYVAWKVNQAFGITSYTLSPQSSYVLYNNVTGTGGNRLSNAHRWDERFSAIGVTVDGVPTPGSICNWEATSGNSAGHVAYVHAVSSNGAISISEYNYVPSCEYNTRTIQVGSNDYPDHFIHVERGI